MEGPGALLTLLAAVLGPAASATLGKLSCKLLPLAALVVGTLANATSGIVLAAQVSHNNSGPILHVRAVVSNRELFNQREDVEVVGEEIFLLVLFLGRGLGLDIVAIEQLQLAANLELGHEMAVLEVGTQVAVLGDVCEKL